MEEKGEGNKTKGNSCPWRGFCERNDQKVGLRGVSQRDR